MFTLAQLESALAIVRAHVPPTPQREWPLLSQRLGASLIVKHENHAPTGAFKVRGGLVYMERLKRERPQVAGVISATTGNHGQSIAFAARAFGVRAVIYVPHGNSPEKNAAMRSLGAELVEHGKDFDTARMRAKEVAVEQKLEFINSFGPDLVVGVASASYELLGAMRDLDVVFVPIGMGSCICGMITVRDLLGLKTEIVGVQAAGAPSYYQSWRQNRIVNTDTVNTKADGLATRMPDAQSVEIIRRGGSKIVLVDDAAIADAIRIYYTDTHNLVEGAGAAPLAAALAEKDRLRGKRVAVMATGGNIDLSLFRTWVAP
ncbi:MAG TPA: threonine dehydratase [Burkholderiales bacterium]|nr:threonine dehydratase [Burkholderiales bacterium]